MQKEGQVDGCAVISISFTELGNLVDADSYEAFHVMDYKDLTGSVTVLLGPSRQWVATGTYNSLWTVWPQGPRSRFCLQAIQAGQEFSHCIFQELQAASGPCGRISGSIWTSIWTLWRVQKLCRRNGSFMKSKACWMQKGVEGQAQLQQWCAGPWLPW